MIKRCKTVESPIGRLAILEENDAIAAIYFENEGDKAPDDALSQDTALLCEAARQLEEYFSKKREGFELPLAPKGTEFQRKVWDTLVSIPYGQTRTYGQIAALVGSPRGARAVGMSNNRNPIPIIIPCHRVVGASGALTGFRGGLDAKERLLMLEQR